MVRARFDFQFNHRDFGTKRKGLEPSMLDFFEHGLNVASRELILRCFESSVELFLNGSEWLVINHLESLTILQV